jgi:hypothetical protein
MDLSRGYALYQVPVRCEAYGGFGETHGVLRFDGRSLRLDWQTKDSVFGVVKSGAQQLEVPLSALDRLRCGAGFCWLSPWLEIVLNDFALATRLPGHSEGPAVRLRVRFADRKALRRLVDAVNHAAARQVHAALDAELGPQLSDIAPELPPPQPIGALTETSPPARAKNPE